MFYFIHGDANQIFEKAQNMAASLLKKKPDASLFKINQDNFSEDKINELLGGQGLFSNKYIVSMSRMLEKSDTADFLMDKLKELKESENIFIWTEEKINKPILKKIEKHAEKVQEFELVKTATKPKMNIFDLANAFGEGDKKKAWVLYQKALADFSPEEIYGTLWWQVKSMLLASKTTNAKEADMKDFPYKKAKGFSARFKEGELQTLASDLILLYHHSRLSGEDIALNLEKFILTK
jgi:DNA polymerase III delta subunit